MHTFHLQPTFTLRYMFHWLSIIHYTNNICITIFERKLFALSWYGTLRYEQNLQLWSRGISGRFSISCSKASTERSNILGYTGCPRRNVPDFGREFLMLKYIDITQNTYIQSWTVTEIMAREKWGFLRFQILQLAQLILHVTGKRPWEWNAVFTVPAWRFAQSAMFVTTGHYHV